MNSYITNESHCTNCNKELDAHTGLNTDDKPAEGALSVCYYCGAISMFDKDLNLRPLLEEELMIIKAEDEESWTTLMHASRFVKQKRRTCAN